MLSPRAMRALLVLGLVMTAGCPYATPPLRGELGKTLTGEHVSSRMSIGVDLVGLAGQSAPRVAVGTGVFVEMAEAGSHPEAEAGAPPTARGKVISRPPDPDETVYTRGAYAELGFDMMRRGPFRVRASVRGERRLRLGELGYAAKMRLDAEGFTKVKGVFAVADRCVAGVGAFYGIGGLGVYAESGPVMFPGENAWATTAGITVRMPAMFGVAIPLPCRH